MKPSSPTDTNSTRTEAARKINDRAVSLFEMDSIFIKTQAKTGDRNVQLDRFIDRRAFHWQPPANPQHLTAEQLADYGRDGFIVVRQALDLRFVETVREASLDLLPIDSRSVKNIEQHNPIFRQVYENQPVQGMVSDLNGPSVMCQSFVFFKPPGNLRPKPWHQDSVYWGTSAETMMNVFVPLTSSNRRNGGVHFIPGSHLLGRLFHRASDDGFGFPNLVCDVSAFREPVVPEVEPRDLILCHNLVVHGSFRNETDEMRINIGFHHRAVGTTLEWL
jgi:Phytanoyl-CoA dioxygenase (PhyH)